jgi:xanthosine utilization system XapX-like protein
MKPREQFALALRIIGVLGIAYVVRAFVRNPSPPTLALIVRVASIFIGAYFIRGASLLVKLAYPETTPEAPEKASA